MSRRVQVCARHNITKPCVECDAEFTRAEAQRRQQLQIAQREAHREYVAAEGGTVELPLGRVRAMLALASSGDAQAAAKLRAYVGEKHGRAAFLCREIDGLAQFLGLA